MALNTVTTGNTVLAADINQLVNVLQKSSGQTEAGKYWLASSSPATSFQFGQYMQSLSRGSVPVSVTIDTSDMAPTNCNSPTTSHLTANGFQIYSTTTVSSGVANVAGNFTIQY